MNGPQNPYQQTYGASSVGGGDPQPTSIPQPASIPYPAPASIPQQPVPGRSSHAAQPQPAYAPQPASIPQPVSIPQPAPANIPYPAPANGQDPRSAPQAATSEPQKCFVHHSYIWLGSIRTVLMIFATIVIVFLSSIVSIVSEGARLFSGDFFVGLVIAGMVLAFAVAIIAIAVVYQVVSYKHLYFTLSADEFNLHSGILNKKRVHVPYQRVQSVDQHASLLQRAFGVCTVSVDTAGGSNNKAIVVPYLTKQQAEWLRTELFRRKSLILAGASASAMRIPGAFAGTPGPAGAMGAQGFASAAEGSSGMVAGAAGAPVWGQNVSRETLAQPAPGAVPISGASPIPGAPGAAPIPGNVLDVGAAVWQDVGGVFAGSALDTGRVTYEYGLTNKELVLTGLSNNTAFLLIVLGALGVLSQLADVLFDLFPKTSESFVEGVAAQAMGQAAGGFIASAVVSALAVFVALWLLSGVGSCISYGGFRARRRDSRIEVERGLLQHTFQGVDIDRVQAVVIKQSFIRRIMGYCEISLGKIDAASEGDGDSAQKSLAQSGVVIHPFVKVDRVPEILAGIIPEYADLPDSALPVAPVALRRALIRRCLWQGSGFWLAVVVAVVQLLVNAAGADGLADFFEMTLGEGAFILSCANIGAVVLYVLAVVLVVLDAVGAVLWFRESSFAYNKRFMQVSVGGFSRETTSFLRQKIQYGFARTNPFQRLAKTATINARTAAGVGGATVSLVDVREEDAEKWLAWLQPRGNVLQ